MSNDQDTASPPPLPKRKRWRKTKWAVLVIGTMLALPCLAIAMWEWSAKRDVQRQLAELRAAGAPTTAEELAVLHRVPADEEDATEEWLQVLRQTEGAKQRLEEIGLRFGSFNWEELPQYNAEWPMHDAALQVQERYRPATEEIERLAPRTGWVRFPIDFSQGYEADMSHIQPLREAASLFELEVYLGMRNGNSQQAARAIHNLHALADSLKNEPHLISLLVFIALHDRAFRCFERASEIGFSEEALESFRTRWVQFDVRGSFFSALQGERIIGLQEVLAAHYAMENQGSSIVARAFLACTRWHDAQAFIKHFQELECVMRDANGFPSIQARHAIFSELEREREDKRTEMFLHVMTHTVLPSLTAAINASLRIQAEKEICLTLIAAERFRRQHGSWPETLESLVPGHLEAVPMDPFDGLKLKYKIEDDCAVVYSIGHNGKDDGGDPWSAEVGQKPLDCTFRIKAPTEPAIAEN